MRSICTGCVIIIDITEQRAVVIYPDGEYMRKDVRCTIELDRPPMVAGVRTESCFFYFGLMKMES